MRLTRACLASLCLAAALTVLAHDGTAAAPSARSAVAQSGGATADESALLERLEGIVNRLIPVVGGDGIYWRVRMTSNPVPNAYALPNGLLVVHRGLLENLPGTSPLQDDELAFVLAHEMMHVALGHATRAASVDRGLWRTLARSGVNRSPLGNVTAAVLRQGASASYSRELETQADHEALLCVAQAGFSPEAALTLFERMQQFEQTRPATLRIFHTHPRTADRSANVRAWLDAHPSSGSSLLGGKPPQALPVTVVMLGDRGLADALAPTAANAETEQTRNLLAEKVPPTWTERLSAALAPMRAFTNLVMLAPSAPPFDRDALLRDAAAHPSTLVLALALNDVKQTNMPWPGGCVYAVHVRLSALLIRPGDGHVIDRIELQASREATLSGQGGQTREDVISETLVRALRPMEALTRSTLRALSASPRPGGEGLPSKPAPAEEIAPATAKPALPDHAGDER